MIPRVGLPTFSSLVLRKAMQERKPDSCVISLFFIPETKSSRELAGLLRDPIREPLYSKNKTTFPAVKQSFSFQPTLHSSKLGSSGLKWKNPRTSVGFVLCGRYWIRTSDPLLVRQVLWTSWANRPFRFGTANIKAFFYLVSSFGPKNLEKITIACFSRILILKDGCFGSFTFY